MKYGNLLQSRLIYVILGINNINHRKSNQRRAVKVGRRAIMDTARRARYNDVSYQHKHTG